MTCAFCHLFEAAHLDREVVAENRAAAAWLHESRAHRGHSVVAARRHVENLSELDDDEAIEFLAIARQVESAALSETSCDRAVLMKLGLQVPHLHLHIYPFERDATREQVMKVIDGEVTDHSSPADQTTFADRMRSRINRGGVR